MMGDLVPHRLRQLNLRAPYCPECGAAQAKVLDCERVPARWRCRAPRCRMAFPYEPPRDAEAETASQEKVA